MASRATISEGDKRKLAGDVHRGKHTARARARGGDVRRRELLTRFRAHVWEYWQNEGRHDLPWRKTKDPYKILVSEVMLQQTQVPRVIEKYRSFLKKFPTIESLARASLAEVLKEWSGLGYNRRGKFLRDAAIAIGDEYAGRVPTDAHALRSIPGIGSYTASAVRAFAFNLPDALIETNIRAAYIHHFFENQGNMDIASPYLRQKISDSAILAIAHEAAEGQDPRKWHWALMDYGAHIKKLHGNPARKSAMYAKQSKFEGSLRQVRGAILRELHKEKSNLAKLPFEKERIDRALASLERDGLIKKKRKEWRIS